MFGKCLEQVKEKSPLVHNITNYVTVNDVANVILAAGASPIMADEPAEAADITAICNGLNINIGTLNRQTIEAMHIAGKRRRSWDMSSCLTRSERELRRSGPTRPYP